MCLRWYACALGCASHGAYPYLPSYISTTQNPSPSLLARPCNPQDSSASCPWFSAPIIMADLGARRLWVCVALSRIRVRSVPKFPRWYRYSGGSCVGSTRTGNETSSLHLGFIPGVFFVNHSANLTFRYWNCLARLEGRRGALH